MKYQYNYSFLNRWMKANGRININTILQAIGSTSNNSLRLWEQGRCPMPVSNILRFCNTFQVPISAFFYDKDNDPTKAAMYVQPNEGDIFSPNGGYVTERKAGSRALLDPLDVSLIPSVVPGLVDSDEAKLTNTETVSSICIQAPDTERGNMIVVGNVSDQNMKALLKLEAKRMEADDRHSEERIRLLEIIAEQQKQIANLTRILDEAKRYNNMNMNDGYVVADHPAHD